MYINNNFIIEINYQWKIVDNLDNEVLFCLFSCECL